MRHYTTDPVKAAEENQLGELRRQLREACLALGCSGMSHTLCMERPERCEILRKLLEAP